MTVRMAAIGERALVEGYALAGVDVVVAEDPTAIRRAWQGLPADVAVVVLTRSADAVLKAPRDLGDRLVVVMTA